MKPLVIIKTVKQEANESTVKVLEGLLQEARKGEIETVFAVSFRPDSSYRCDSSAMFNGLRKIGALEVIKAAMLRDMGTE